MLTSLLLSALLSFSSPVHHELSLAGNFGEPRPNHFHAGCDVKTEQVEGKPIFSIADGYISRVTVGVSGFGNAVYVRHPNGYTSVYCHLQRFTPQVAAMVKIWQYEHEQYVADVEFQPTDFPVSEGQLIAVSGNTGASTAPHLHLEVHDTRTWDVLDPLDFIGKYVKDTTAPTADAIMAMPVDGEGSFCGKSYKQRFALSENMTEMNAWGKVGFALHAEDKMEGSWNRFGIRYTTLIVDGDTVFSSNVNRIPVASHRMVNSWGDYDYYMENRVWFMKSFIDPGNSLPVISANDQLGIITFNEERPYNIRYVLRDYFGNSTEYSFVVNGKRQDIESRKDTGAYMLSYDKDNDINLQNMRLHLKKGLLPMNMGITPQIAACHEGISDAYSFRDALTPLFDWGEISLKVLSPVENPDKLYIVCHDTYDRYQEGEYKDGWVKGRLRDLGLSYEVAYDDNPPEVDLESASAGVLRLNVYDSKSGLSSFKAYVDGKFVLFEDVPKSTVKVCHLSQTPLKRTGATRTLTVYAKDNRNNSIQKNMHFDY